MPYPEPRPHAATPLAQDPESPLNPPVCLDQVGSTSPVRAVRKLALLPSPLPMVCLLKESVPVPHGYARSLRPGWRLRNQGSGPLGRGVPTRTT